MAYATKSEACLAQFKEELAQRSGALMMRVMTDMGENWTDFEEWLIEACIERLQEEGEELIEAAEGIRALPD